MKLMLAVLRVFERTARLPSFINEWRLAKPESSQYRSHHPGRTRGPSRRRIDADWSSLTHAGEGVLGQRRGGVR